MRTSVIGTQKHQSYAIYSATRYPVSRWFTFVFANSRLRFMYFAKSLELNGDF